MCVHGPCSTRECMSCVSACVHVYEVCVRAHAHEVCVSLCVHAYAYPGVKYKTKGEHYNDPCGVFGNMNKDSNGVRIPYGADCAGATRAVGLCLNILCIPYEHVNENKWKQQWCRVNINGKHYVIDPYVSPYVMEETYYVRLYPPYML